MSGVVRGVVLALSCSFVLGCGPVRTRPSVLADAAASAETPQAKEAAALAPASFAEAERLRREAERTYQSGDETGSQILGEHAIAAYARAFVQARTVRATKLAEDARAVLGAAEGDLHKLDEEQTRAAAEVAALEAKIKVTRDALPPPQSEAAEPAREAARLDAARALVTEARLLCVATRLLAPDAEGLAAADAAVAEAEKALDPKTRPAPIDLATRARAGCLSVLSKVRRGVARNPSASGADALLSEISRDGTFAPFRDDRGIVLTVETPFSGTELTKPAAAKVELAGKIAAAHPELPLVLVVHDDATQRDEGRDRKRGEAARRALGARADKAELVLAGATRPVVDPKKGGRNERLEIVFVDSGR